MNNVKISNMEMNEMTGLLYDIACTIKEVIEENGYLRQENTELHKEVEEYHDRLEQSFRLHNEAQNQWLNALLSGDLQLTGTDESVKTTKI